jgi:ABC-type multidrug transport system ATPase subunit
MKLMRIELSGAGKRFNREWIFRNAGLEFISGSSYAITGPNGSGKSTLLQCIGGMLQLSEGAIHYETPDKKLPGESVFSHLSFCAPYLDLVEELTLTEFLHFHEKFKSFIPGFNTESVIGSIGLEAAAHKQIRNFSSGMKQRVKLAQSILFDASIILLDEPCSNLDAAGIILYHNLVKTYCSDRLVIVCSNDEVEYDFCNRVISILDFKNSSAPIYHHGNG